MNLHSKKARLPIAALGVTALCTTGLGVLATSAQAASSITVTPTTTSVNLLDLGAAIGDGDAGSTADAGHAANSFAPSGPTTPQAAAAAAVAKGTFALRVTSANPDLALSLDSYTSPTGSVPSAVNDVLWYNQPNPGSDTAPTTGWANLDSSASTSASVGLTPTTSATGSPGYIYLAPDQPGTYKVRVVDTQGTSAVDDDVASAVITLNAKDVYGLGTVADDWKPGVTNDVTTAGVGAPIKTTVDLGSLTLVDGRGSNAGKGVLGDGLANLTGVAYSGAPSGAVAAVKVTNPDGVVTLPALATTTTGTETATALFDTDGDGLAATTFTLGTTTTTVQSNSVDTLTSFAVTPVTGSVASASSTTAQIKTGTPTATYTALAQNTTPSPGTGQVNNATVYFRLTPSTTGGVPDTVLTANGTLVSSNSTTGVKVYSASTGSNGVASLAVTSSVTTAAANLYTVEAVSNGHNSVPTTITASYQASAAASFESANTTEELNPVAQGGVTTTLKGRVLDQFGGLFQPASSATQTVTVTVPAGGSTICNAVITGGTFSCAYTPASTPTAGSNVSYRYAYAGATNFNGTINYASAAAAASITVASPVDGVLNQPLQSAVVAPTSASQVTGNVYDSGNVGLAYKPVTITGSAGVYFSTSATPSATTSADDLKSSVTVSTNNTGAFSGVYVFYTKLGSQTITVTSGAATKAITTKTTESAPAANAYKVTVNDVSGKPGSTLILTGSVTDAFGNAVNNAPVYLTTETQTLGVIGDTNPSTNSNGVWSTTFITGANQSGSFKINAYLEDPANPGSRATTNPTAATQYSTFANLTIPHGEYTDQGTITLAGQEVTISATGSLLGGGKAQLSGMADPNVTVEIWKKGSGDDSFTLLGNVKADGNGAWGIGTTIVKSTSFFARSGVISSPTVATVVISTQSVKAKALGGGKVQFTVLGAPNVAGYANVYQAGTRIGHVKTNSKGDATVVVQSKAGKRTFEIYFAAPGTTLKGTTLTGTVK